MARDFKMKQCPRCKRTCDETQNFCLEDGCVLIPPYTQDTYTWPMDSCPQEVLPVRELSLSSFAYPKPDWITDGLTEVIANIARAAFLLLVFERTTSGCWAKTYLYRQKATNHELPRAFGALTGTPFALIAITSYVREPETILQDWIYPPLLETLAGIVKANGDYIREYRTPAIGIRTEVPEPPRHAAGGCLSSLLSGAPRPPDEATLLSLCDEQISKLKAYDKAAIFRVLLQASEMPSISRTTRQKTIAAQNSLLTDLIESGKSAASEAQIWGDSSYGYQSDSTNQWGSVFWLLAGLVTRQVSPTLRQDLESLMRRFLLAQSYTDYTESNPLPKAPEAGEQVFGNALAVVGWRTIERYDVSVTSSEVHQARTYAQKAVERIAASWPGIIASPSIYPENQPEYLEGYLGWGGLCLAASSLGIRISSDDSHHQIALAQEMNDLGKNETPDGLLSDEYRKLIASKRLYSEGIAALVARVASRVEIVYRAAIRK